MSNLITTPQLKNLIDDPELVLLDCRSDLQDRSNALKLYLQGHIPGAIHAHLEDDLSAPLVKGETGRHPLPTQQQWQSTLRRWGITHNSKVVVYDQSNSMFAVRTWWMMKWAGINHVCVLNGGLNNWLSLGGETNTSTPPVELSDIEITINSDLTVTANDIINRHNDTVLLDARALNRYQGEIEPLDTKAGHIPGAQNADFSLNLNSENMFHTPEQLGARFSATNGKRVICYCGSGVTACHNILAIAESGQPMPSLYPGSWSEWITNEKHIIATGQEGDIF